ncbi:MAG: adenylate cyclase [Alphaproteobacteria bacterium]|nr:adenylate cyclase [Alphaproteobacteria bacterium]
MERRLAAILVADVVGYSQLMGEDEVGTLAALNTHRKELIDPEIARHTGRIVKLMGDGALVEFASVIDAVQCAITIQHGMRERNADVPENRRIEFRIGINVGDVIVENEDIYGDGVNIAARLETLAGPGDILISRSARDQIRDKLDVSLEDLGEHEVKNIARPIRVFRVLQILDDGSSLPLKVRQSIFRRRFALIMTSTAFLAVASAVAWLGLWVPEPVFEASPLSAKSSIAVLPFMNLSKDPEQEYFSDGITNDIITDLSKFRDLFVIASNSTFAYKGKPVNIQQVGRELAVRYVLEGSVQRSGERVRINAQLIDVDTARHLWAERYDEAIDDIFDLQDRITKRIVRTLTVRLTDIELDRVSAKATRDLEAYDYVLRGREHLMRFGETDNFEARVMFRKAIDLDASYADAYAGLGWTYLNTFLFGWTDAPKEALERSQKLAQQTLAINDSSVDGHRLLGRVYLNRHQHDLALIEVERAIALNPNDAQSYAEQGVILVWSGRADGAIISLETALRFDPKSNAVSLAHLGLAYYLKMRYAGAAISLERSIVQSPDFQFAHEVLAAAYGQLGRASEASREANTVRRINPFFEVDEYGRQFRDPQDAAHIIVGLRKAGL